MDYHQGDALDVFRSYLVNHFADYHVHKLTGTAITTF